MSVKTLYKSKKTDKQILESVSSELPALLRAQKVIEKSQKLKNCKNFSCFDKESIDKIHKMLDNNEELTANIDKYSLVGQAIMTIVSFAASEKIPVEICVNDYIDKLINNLGE